MRTDTSLKNSPAGADDEFEPAYLKLHETGELKKRAEMLWSMMEDCRLCPRECGVDRLQGEHGFCRAPGVRLVVSSYGAHFGEERPLVGTGGSGTIFFSHCGLHCVFCQNWEISIAGQGIELTVEDLAEMMLDLQASGCHNINVVTPTHYSAHILRALDHATARGLRLPLVYNSSGWERLEILALLDGIVDIYMPDFKYCTADIASQYSYGAENYSELAAEAILEMHRQVGAARYVEGGIMQRGLVIRHLVLPNAVSGSEKIMEWIAMNLPKDTFVNIMAQYHPDYKAYDIPELSRKLTPREYKAVVDRAKRLGLANLDIQGSWLL
jgi:putative pyruvate formate lyase activating enzyme